MLFAFYFSLTWAPVSHASIITQPLVIIFVSQVSFFMGNPVYMIYHKKCIKTTVNIKSRNLLTYLFVRFRLFKFTKPRFCQREQFLLLCILHKLRRTCINRNLNIYGHKRHSKYYNVVPGHHKISVCWAKKNVQSMQRNGTNLSFWARLDY